MKPTNFAYYLTKYLSIHLPDIRGLSSNTIMAYRDTFTLLFRYFQEIRNIPPEKLTIQSIDRDAIAGYLDWLETSRKCSASTRNQRLASLKAFFQYLQTETPEYVYQCQQILSIPAKKALFKTMEYLSLDGVKAILDSPNTSTKDGRRDIVLLTLLYDSGARVQEIADMKVKDIRLNKPATIRLTGKGNKTRTVPIMEPTALLVAQYIKENILDSKEKGDYPLFRNRSGNKLTRGGIAYILKKYVNEAKIRVPSVIPESVSPHHLRHSKAMHLLQSGVNLIYIRDFLGHVEISTTQVYAKVDGKIKREALENAYQPVHKSELPTWKQDQGLLAWLKNLG
jgi:integrase/recombinase XerD